MQKIKPTRSFWWWTVAAGLLVAVAAAAWFGRGFLVSSTRAASQLSPPPLSPSRYLNTGADAQYVGSAGCIECHRGNHTSYLLTPHSRALAELDPTAEPADTRFVHRASNRTYRVYRKDGQMRHEEVLSDAVGTEVARVDLPIRYLAGSGHFCRSYLAEVDGFLVESPLTWYVSRKDWHMSPGYDFPQHWGFERPVRVGCLYCHAGRVEEQPRSTRVTIHEQAIGCESCHGPGSLHVQKHRQAPRGPALGPTEEDLTIVNPGKLTRPLLESVCAACHLSTASSVMVRGRKLTDFRPGQPLSDYRIDYSISTGGRQMTVVGHMEQLRQSRCYQKSSEMSCLTCHDLHARELPKDRIVYHRQKCLDCHASLPCKVDPAERKKTTSQDSCIVCHMPTGDTDIPHIAFTHHRIGIHRRTPEPSAPSGVPELIPLEVPEHFSALERQRNLGLAYVAALEDPKNKHHAEAFAQRALQLLEPVHSAGMRDGATCQGLAMLLYRKDPQRASTFAQEALQDAEIPNEMRAYALAIRADSFLQMGDRPAAIRCLEEIVTLRRLAEDWRLLGKCYQEEHQAEKALAALTKAVEIRPYRHDIHGDLSHAYRVLGDEAKARDHLARARWLLENRQE